MINRFLMDALFCHRSPYFAILPYNLNWMIHSRRDLLPGDTHFAPITVVDVGCRGGLPDELYPIRRMIHHIGFDADAVECERLNSQPHDLFKRDIFPVFLGDKDGECDFHLFKSRGQSSALPPDSRFAKLFAAPDFAIEKTIRVKTTTLDAFFQANPTLSRPDMIKLDTQGTELAILKGAEDCLRTSSLVEVEVEFLPHYEGQGLFHDILQFMHSHGFELLYLNRVFQQRTGYPGWAKGQITFGDALFGRREDCIEALDSESVQKYLVLLVNYGYLDIVHNILETRHLPIDIEHLFSLYLQRRVRRWRINLVRCFIPVIDKIILLLMHTRKHNSLMIDSDRSWPFR